MNNYANNAGKRAAELRAQENWKNQRRSQLRSQISGLENELKICNTQISSLKSKLEQQRAMKGLFEERCTDLDTEKAAKSVCMQNVEPYRANLKFDLGYTDVMNDLLHGSTAQSYSGYSQETSQFMQMEINENQTKLEELRTEKNSKTAVIAGLQFELARV